MDKKFDELRREMVERLVRLGIIKSEKVREAMLRVPRHEFVPSNLRQRAYEDVPLPIGYGQTISAPHMVAMMCEQLELEPHHRVLEVGSGSGYHACVVSCMVSEVYTVERIPELAEMARENIRRAGVCGKIEIIVGDGSKGYPEKAPYHRIFVTAGAPKVPEALKQQLEIGGKLLIPVGSRAGQELIRITRISEDEFKEEDLGGCVFVPLVGEDAWDSFF